MKIEQKHTMKTKHLSLLRNNLQAISNSIIQVFKCGNLSRYYADLNFKFVIVQVLFIDKDG